MLRRATLAFVLALLPSIARVERRAAAQDLPPTSGERLLDEAVKVARDNWWDRKNRSKIDWDGLKDRFRDEARRASTPVEAHRVVNKLFAELKTSHLALMEGSVYDRELGPEFRNRPTLRAGVDLDELGGRFFVSSILENSPAKDAGLLIGDEVLTINGKPPAENPLLEDGGHDPGLFYPPSYVLKTLSQEKTPEEYTFVVRHEANGPKHEITFKPITTSMVEAARSSVRVLEVQGKKLGVVHLWHFMTPAMNAVLKEALDGPLAKCDGLILDVRGRGGRADVIWQVMSHFQGDSPNRWKKPVVVLQDATTRSAKEIFAWAWKGKNLGKIVGQRSAGAVIGCQFKKLFDGSVLVYPAQDVRPMTKGVSLEGNGVEPDVAVNPGDLRFRKGRDPILEEGARVLLGDVLALKKPATKPSSKRDEIF